MATETLEPIGLRTVTTGPELDQFFYGWRMVPRPGLDHEQQPLTPWDVLHPQEDDFIVTNDDHVRDLLYIMDVLRRHLRHRPDIKVLCDHRTDWQVPGIIPHGPDVTVLEGLTEEWDGSLGTFPLVDMGARPLLTVEVVSPSTRDVDLNKKVREYWRAGVPIYVIVDRDQGDGRTTVLKGHTAGRRGYGPMPVVPGRGIWVDTVGLWIDSEGHRAVLRDSAGNVIPDGPGLADMLDEVTEERDAAIKKANKIEKKLDKAEKKAAEAEKKAVEAEKKAAEDRAALEAEIARLRARMGPASGRTNGHQNGGTT